MEYLPNFFSKSAKSTPLPDSIQNSPQHTKNFRNANRRKRRRLQRNKKFKETQQQKIDDVLVCTVEGQCVKPIEEIQTLVPPTQSTKNEQSCIIS